ncbi:MAG UNVERIFIED_CONTAM: hypothetical protein LVT10_02320 [Anaerolineae bacterium]
MGHTQPFAQDAPTVESLASDISSMKASIDTSWLLLTGFLVFFMRNRVCHARSWVDPSNRGL